MAVPSGLPNYTRHITSHNSSGEAIIHTSTPGDWTSIGEDRFGFSVAYTTSSFPPDLNNDADISTHSAKMESKNLGLVSPNGTVCRVVDFAPNTDPFMHRTRSLDYGVVLEGEIIMELDSGEKVLMKKGDIAVQRGTMHGWRNPSKENWTRMLFVLQDCKPISAEDGKQLGEDLGKSSDLPPSDGANA
ncbi:cupin domain protein [Aspergillus costaricaensis CBS 115574]|uniref:Cupin domain protein n=1 Tax=Aspergillus costaricaensis CBS 115574 TaxID=1448317 RepID=A0ACD1IE68_9EURO|nr:cupin domain protein [Aspergillus costaricaensis CBS 115574]RAK88072.1 cupin domain protein [Aspergillus costaricaensis CBS 115574]